MLDKFQKVFEYLNRNNLQFCQPEEQGILVVGVEEKSPYISELEVLAKNLGLVFKRKEEHSTIVRDCNTIRVYDVIIK